MSKGGISSNQNRYALLKVDNKSKTRYQRELSRPRGVFKVLREIYGELREDKIIRVSGSEKGIEDWVSGVGECGKVRAAKGKGEQVGATARGGGGEWLTIDPRDLELVLKPAGATAAEGDGRGDDGRRRRRHGERRIEEEGRMSSRLGHGFSQPGEAKTTGLNGEHWI
ncbi:hypothetical protein Droror1_Dr00022165 [Drosera rotundifolia]